MRRAKSYTRLSMNSRALFVAMLKSLMASLMLFSSQSLTALYCPENMMKNLLKNISKNIVPIDLAFKIFIFVFGLFFFGSFGFHVINVFSF